MAIYDFKCGSCGTIKSDVILSITHTPEDRPKCAPCDCYYDYYITSVPMVMWTDPIIEPFRTLAGKKPEVISTTRQRREFMARNDLVDANERYSAPTIQEERAEIAEKQATIDAITPTPEQSLQLKAAQIDSILEE
jgi:hypothetical protein